MAAERGFSSVITGERLPEPPVKGQVRNVINFQSLASSSSAALLGGGASPSPVGGENISGAGDGLISSCSSCVRRFVPAVRR